MIPTYNCATYLRQTLESVLAQDPGPDRMQIEVVDDVSTKDDPEAVVRELGKGRVQFYRHPRNVGATANFNTCLQRSRGRWVHILHGDDYILPGFYQHFGQVAQQLPDTGLIACRVFRVDEQGEIESLLDRTQALEQPSRDVTEYVYENPCQFCGVVLSRSVVEITGGFSPDLCHTADWEMWIRAIRERGGVCLNRPLACYRVFAGNDTARLRRTGENLRDILRVGSMFEATVPTFDPSRFRNMVCTSALRQALFFARLGDGEAARANRQVWRELATWKDRVIETLRSVWRHVQKDAG
jgi:glycosyltransferase involved in cell wall biosynthesis